MSFSLIVVATMVTSSPHNSSISNHAKKRLSSTDAMDASKPKKQKKLHETSAVLRTAGDTRGLRYCAVQPESLLTDNNGSVSSFDVSLLFVRTRFTCTGTLAHDPCVLSSS